MQRSAELEHVCRRIVESFRDLNSTAYADMWHDDAALLVGSDAEEWWEGAEEIRALIRAQFEALAELPASLAAWDIKAIDAWSAGSFGWAAVRSRVGPDGEPAIDVRMTAVFVLEKSAWRLTHVHISHGQPNDLGLPTSIEQILDAVARDEVSLPSAPPTGLVTVVFTDIESSTEITAAIGDAAWFELLQRHDALIEDCMTQRQGSIIKSIGDGTMLVFESNAEAALFAMELRSSLASDPQGSSLRVRIGIHCGDAIHHDDDLFGTTVNVAARVTGAADGSETLVSAAVFDALRDDRRFPMELAGSFDLKGISKRHDLFRLSR